MFRPKAKRGWCEPAGHGQQVATSERTATSSTAHPRYRMTEMAHFLCVKLGWYREVNLRPYVWAGVYFFASPLTKKFKKLIIKE